MGERKDWEITWAVWLQIAASCSKWEVETCRVIGVEREAAVKRAVSRANAVLEEHGSPGTAALSAVEGSLEVLRGTEWFGLVRTAVITRTDAQMPPSDPSDPLRHSQQEVVWGIE